MDFDEFWDSDVVKIYRGVVDDDDVLHGFALLAFQSGQIAQIKEVLAGMGKQREARA